MHTIKLRRLALGFTRSDFAARCNLDPARVAVLENGQAPATPDELSQLSEALGVSVTDLLRDRVVRVPVTPARVRTARRRRTGGRAA